MAWQISGDYMETCNCDFLCPCPLTGLNKSTHGTCTFAMAFRVNDGNYEGTSLKGRRFVIVGRTPGEMIEGNWEVGLIVDDEASQEQEDALAAIVGGEAGGPIANLAPLIGNFLGVEKRPIRFDGSGNKWSLSVPDAIEQGVEGVMGLGGENLYLDNAGHPGGNRLGLAHSTGTKINAFGVQYEEQSGRNNGHFAPFSWSS